MGADTAVWGKGNGRDRLMELLTVVSLVLVLAHALIVVCTVPPIVFDSTKNSGSWYNQIL